MALLSRYFTQKAVSPVTSNNNYAGLDRFRMAAAVLVIAIHTGPLTSYNGYAFKLPRHDSMYVFLIPAVYYLFHMLLWQKGRTGFDLRALSTWIYILHPVAIILIRGIGKLTGLTYIMVTDSLIYFIAVTLLSIVLAGVTVRVVRFRKKSPKKHRAWAEIHLNHLEHNGLELKKVLPSDCQLMAVVKADAYGHGSIHVAKHLAKSGVKHFAVAEISEGIALRKQGINGEILIFGYTAPDRFCDLARYRLTQTVFSADYGNMLNEYGRKLKIHIKIDTGMHRLGENDANIEEILAMYRYPKLQVTGTYSHMAAADSHKQDDIEFTYLQLERFNRVVDQLKAEGVKPGTLHMQSSYGILNYPEIHLGLARPGIALYGLLCDENDKVKVQVNLRPALSLKARVSQVKYIQSGTSIGYGRNFIAAQDMKIATVSIGYADGFPRVLAEKGGCVLIRGQKAQITGNICMDQLMVDVTHIDGVQQGDIVTLIGQDGEQRITAGQIARQSGTITNEILSRIGNRVERVYLTE